MLISVREKGNVIYSSIHQIYIVLCVCVHVCIHTSIYWNIMIIIKKCKKLKIKNKINLTNTLYFDIFLF